MDDYNTHEIRAFGLGLSNKEISWWALLRPYVKNIVMGTIFLIATNILFLILPSLINAGISLLENNKPATIPYFSSIEFNNIYHVIFSIIVIAISGGIIRTLSRVFIFNVGRSTERDVRQLLFYRMSILDDAFYRKHSTGDIMNHLTTDVTNIRLLTGFTVLNVINIIAVFLINVPLLFAINKTIAFCALLPFPLMIFTMQGLSARLFRASKEYQHRLDSLVSHIQENLLGAHVVRLFHRQNEEERRFFKTNEHTFKAAIKQAKIRALLLPLMRLVIGISVTLIIWAGSTALAKGIISAGDFVEINARILQLTWPAMSIGFVMSMYSRGKASIERINSLLGFRPQIVDGSCELSELNRLKVEKLVINRATKDEISFSLEKGQMLALVGMSGSYKTALLKALTRRTKIPDHKIFFNDIDANSLSLSSFYRHIGIVVEEPTLFHKTIRENICLLKPDAALPEILDVLRITRLDHDLKQWSDGLDTIVGERGITLSGGQRQRVALARILLAKRPLIILDDALSAVDKETKRHIMTELQQSLPHTMIIIATHHLASVESARHIIVLDKGKIAASGNFEDLIKNSQLFRELWGFDHAGLNP